MKSAQKNGFGTKARPHWAFENSPFFATRIIPWMYEELVMKLECRNSFEGVIGKSMERNYWDIQPVWLVECDYRGTLVLVCINTLDDQEY